MKREAPEIGGLFSARRLVITGANGAGKTRMAERIAAQTGRKLIHMDALKLTSGWQTRPAEESRAALLRATSGPDWILEGGPGCLLPPVLARADAILWLRPPHALRLWRILRRSLRERGRTRAELPPGNPESFDARALRFALRSFRQSARFDAEIAAALKGYAPLILRSDA